MKWRRPNKLILKKGSIVKILNTIKENDYFVNFRQTKRHESFSCLVVDEMEWAGGDSLTIGDIDIHDNIINICLEESCYTWRLGMFDLPENVDIYVEIDGKEIFVPRDS